MTTIINKIKKMKAIWQGRVIAESDDTISLEGNYYFPADSIKREFFEESTTHTLCPWRGRAYYYHIRHGEELNPNGAWYYPDPSPAGAMIKDFVAFGGGVIIER
jgi:uncharacterized protein (DUF427 family)